MVIKEISIGVCNDSLPNWKNRPQLTKATQRKKSKGINTLQSDEEGGLKTPSSPQKINEVKLRFQNVLFLVPTALVLDYCLYHQTWSFLTGSVT